MSTKILGVHRFMSCLAATVFLLTGIVCGPSLVLARAEKAPSTASEVAPTKPARSSTEKAITPSTANLAPGEKVNINTATKEKLSALPGIGPTKAQAIIDGRPYAKPEDIMKVRGIKKGTYDRLKDLITVQ